MPDRFDPIPLTRLNPELKAYIAEVAATSGASVVPTGRPVPPYRWLYNAVLDGELPAAQDGSGHYQFDRGDVPKIADDLGLTVAKPALIKPSRKPAPTQAA